MPDICKKPVDFVSSLSTAIRVPGLQMCSSRPILVRIQPEPSMLGFGHRKPEESGVYILGFGALRLSLPRWLTRCCAALPLLAAFEEFLSRRESFCRFNLWFVQFTSPHTMKVVAAYLLALLGGNESPSAKDLKSILGSGSSCSHFVCSWFFFPFLFSVLVRFVFVSLSSENKQECI